MRKVWAFIWHKKVLLLFELGGLKMQWETSYFKASQWVTLWWFLSGVHPYQPTLDFAFFILEMNKGDYLLKCLYFWHLEIVKKKFVNFWIFIVECVHYGTQSLERAFGVIFRWFYSTFKFHVL